MARIEMQDCHRHGEYLVVAFDVHGSVHRCMTIDLHPDEHPALAAAWDELRNQTELACESVLLDVVGGGGLVPDAPTGITKPICRICDASVDMTDPATKKNGTSWYCPSHA